MLLGFVIVVVVLAYLLWPLDAIPDVIPIFGWIDDVIVLFAGVLAWWRL